MVIVSFMITCGTSPVDVFLLLLFKFSSRTQASLRSCQYTVTMRQNAWAWPYRCLCCPCLIHGDKSSRRKKWYIIMNNDYTLVHAKYQWLNFLHWWSPAWDSSAQMPMPGCTVQWRPYPARTQSKWTTHHMWQFSERAQSKAKLRIRCIVSL